MQALRSRRGVALIETGLLTVLFFSVALLAVEGVHLTNAVVGVHGVTRESALLIKNQLLFANPDFPFDRSAKPHNLQETLDSRIIRNARAKIIDAARRVFPHIVFQPLVDSGIGSGDNDMNAKGNWLTSYQKADGTYYAHWRDMPIGADGRPINRDGFGYSTTCGGQSRHWSLNDRYADFKFRSQYDCREAANTDNDEERNGEILFSIWKDPNPDTDNDVPVRVAAHSAASNPVGNNSTDGKYLTNYHFYFDPGADSMTRGGVPDYFKSVHAPSFATVDASGGPVGAYARFVDLANRSTAVALAEMYYEVRPLTPMFRKVLKAATGYEYWVIHASTVA